MRYFISADLAGEVLAVLNQLKAEINPAGFMRAPIHLTLIPPSTLTETPAKFDRRLRAFLAATPPPGPLTLTGLDQYLLARQVAAVGIAPDASFTEWQRELASQSATGLQPTTPSKRFRPHLTLKHTRNRRPPAALTARLTPLRGQHLTVTGLILWQLLDDRWQPRHLLQ